VEILEQRFGRLQQIISAHMDEILKIQPCSSDQPSLLQFLYDKLSVHVRGLSSLGVTAQEYGSLLIPIIMSKLPNEIRLEIARKSTTDVWKISELLETIKGEIEAREASEAIKAQEFQGRKHTPGLESYPQLQILWFPCKAKNFNFAAFIAMGSITQPPARKFDYRRIEKKFSRRIIAVLFASKLVMEQITALKQRNAETAMENIIN